MGLAGCVDSLVMICALTEEAHALQQTNVLPARQHNLVKPIVQGDLEVCVWEGKWTSDMVFCLLGHNLTCFAANKRSHWQALSAWILMAVTDACMGDASPLPLHYRLYCLIFQPQHQSLLT